MLLQQRPIPVAKLVSEAIERAAVGNAFLASQPLGGSLEAFDL